MAVHDFNGTTHCINCGTPSKQTQQTACPGPQAPSKKEQLRPEPTRRVYASEDDDAIHARMMELRAAEAAARNNPVE